MCGSLQRAWLVVSHPPSRASWILTKGRPWASYKFGGSTVPYRARGPLWSIGLGRGGTTFKQAPALSSFYKEECISEKPEMNLKSSQDHRLTVPLSSQEHHTHTLGITHTPAHRHSTREHNICSVSGLQRGWRTRQKPCQPDTQEATKMNPLHP